MGCGASTDSGSPAGKGPKPAADGPKPVASEANLSPPPKDGNSDWQLLVPSDDLSKVLAGASIPGYFLTVHDNKKGEAPRLSVVSLADGSLQTVKIKDKGRGLAAAKDLECLFMVDPNVAGTKYPLYCALTSVGEAWMFRISKKRSKWVAHKVHAFKVSPPAGEKTEHTNCEGARAYCEGGRLWLEYGSRGGQHNGEAVTPWVARCPLDLKAIKAGTFAPDPATLDVTYWPAAVDGNPAVRQCAAMGQAVGMARYGQLYAAAYDDEVHETDFVSYIMERLPGVQSGGVENFKPLYRLRGCKIEAMYDVTKDVSIFATDDEGKGAILTVLHRASGLSWRVAVAPPAGADLRLYGISGLSPVDPAIKKKKKKDDSDSDSESEEEDSEEEEEEQEEQQEEEEPPQQQEEREAEQEEQEQQQEEKQEEDGAQAAEPEAAGGGNGDDAGGRGGGDDQ